jgi:hypothetical protein
MVNVSPGKEREFRYLQGWIAASADPDRGIHAAAVTDGSSAPAKATTDNLLSRPLDRLETESYGQAGRRRVAVIPAAGQRRSIVWIHVYVAEKLRELDRDRPARTPWAEQLGKPASRKPPLSWLARAAGRSLHRIGEGLESWAAPNEHVNHEIGLTAHTSTPHDAPWRSN